jgi:hypothetical protein
MFRARRVIFVRLEMLTHRADNRLFIRKPARLELGIDQFSIRT